MEKLRLREKLGRESKGLHCAGPGPSHSGETASSGLREFIAIAGPARTLLCKLVPMAHTTQGAETSITYVTGQLRKDHGRKLSSWPQNKELHWEEHDGTKTLFIESYREPGWQG